MLTSKISEFFGEFFLKLNISIFSSLVVSLEKCIIMHIFSSHS